MNKIPFDKFKLWKYTHDALKQIMESLFTFAFENRNKSNREDSSPHRSIKSLPPPLPQIANDNKGVAAVKKRVSKSND